METNSNEESASAEASKNIIFDHLSALLEAGIFVAEEPITIDQLAKLSGDNASLIKQKLDALMEHYRRYPRGIRLVETAGGYRFETDPTYAPALKKYYKARESSRLTKAAMEALSIIAYKQPITVPEINEIRSVDSGGVIQKLMEKNLIRILGRKKVVGKPLLYGTTKQFLVKFGLNSIEDLPDFEEFLHITGSEIEPDKLKQEFSEHFGKTGEDKMEEDNIERVPDNPNETGKSTEPVV
jgi:segregation and condensation protein B